MAVPYFTFYDPRAASAARTLLRRAAESSPANPIRLAYEVLLEQGMQLGTPPPSSGSPQRQRGVPKVVAREVWDRDGWECRHCGSHRDLTADHVVPVSKGGADEMSNYQTLCRPCNSRKGARV